MQNTSHDLNYGVIVDCGSSGSRAHIFRWRPSRRLKHVELLRDKPGGKPLNLHITPGLSSFKDEPDKASDYMEPIMQFISKSVPQDRHLDTPIYFLATAGMRLLDDSVRKKILTDITRDIRAKFNFPKIKSQVISGAVEGVYSWLSLNVNEMIKGTSDRGRSYGMIELGGASTQITFELNPEIEALILNRLNDSDASSAFKTERVNLDLGSGKSVNLFATTFLGLGVNSAREAAIDLLVKDYLYSTEGTETTDESRLKKFDGHLKDPCLPNGSSEIIVRPIELLHKSQQSVGFISKQGGETFNVRLEGNGDFLTCITLLDRTLQIMRKEKLNCPSEKSPCPMALLGTNFMPYERFPFVGLSEFFFTTNEMMNASGLFNRTKVLHETQRICSTDYNLLHDLYMSSGVTQKDRILYECFKASWLLTLLHNSGFRMPVDYNDFRTVDKLDGEEIDWTIGAMISEVALNQVGNEFS